VDLDSTNGSFVDGERVRGEVPIASGVSLKFGDVELLFEPTDDALGVGKGGGTVVMAGFASPPASSAPPAKAPAPARGPTLAGPLNPPPAIKQPPIKQPPKAKAPVPPKAAAGAKPARPGAPSKKKGKGCGANVVVLLLGAGGMAAVVYWFLA
jgi:adenylate cyclase